jgi:transcriptional regulator with XRE-family HTH domain
MSTFGDILREKRRLAGLSQRLLAERAALDFSYISKLENGRLPPPSAETVVRLANLLGCPPEDLLSPAKKLTTELSDAATSEPSAVRFLQEASRLQLSPDEWERLIGTMHGLRGRPDDRGAS